MVTIINGEIVPDSDPRAKAYRERKNNANRAQANTGTSNESRPWRTQPVQDGGQGREQDNANSPFTAINNYLLNVGVPRFTVGGRMVEPVVLVGLLLILIFVGFRGLMIAALIYFVFSSSQRNRGAIQRQGLM